MDREKVFDALRNCITEPKCRDCPWESCEKFHQTKTIPLDLCLDILELLKEQKAELSFREAKAITHTATKLDDATCPSCGNVVGEKIRTGAIGQSVVQVQWDYCRFCGQKLDWEGR